MLNKEQISLTIEQYKDIGFKFKIQNKLKKNLKLLSNFH